jgi:exodeoxyribonuclease VII small subunit
MTNRKKTADQPASQLSFEKALERLEKIVEQMEAAELPLEEVLRQYEEGTELVKFCSQKLEEAEKKVEILAKKKDGSPHLKKFQAEEQGKKPEKPDDSSEADNERKLL